jgi:hypothetical protein
VENTGADDPPVGWIGKPETCVADVISAGLTSAGFNCFSAASRLQSPVRPTAGVWPADIIAAAGLSAAWCNRRTHKNLSGVKDFECRLQ